MTSGRVLPPNYFGHGYAFRRRPINHSRFVFTLALLGGIALGLPGNAIASCTLSTSILVPR